MPMPREVLSLLWQLRVVRFVVCCECFRSRKYASIESVEATDVSKSLVVLLMCFQLLELVADSSMDGDF